MGKIVKLKDKVTQEDIYPITSGKSVLNENGSSILGVLDSEIREFFMATDNYVPKINGLRFQILAEEYKVLFRFIYCCGLRVSEARKLKMKNIVFEKNTAVA